MNKITYYLESLEAMQHFAAQTASHLSAPCIFYLSGNLGAGKTTFVRLLLQQLGVQESIKSPSFSIFEYYHLTEKDFYIFHLDLYRLKNPKELEYVGIRDYLGEKAIWFIEWPENGKSFLPQADLNLYFSFPVHAATGRSLHIESNSFVGETLLSSWKKLLFQE